MKKLLTVIIIMFASTLMAANPVVENVSFQQTQDGTGTVLISFDLSDADGDLMDITLNASSNGGLTWNVQCDSLVGAVGEDITAGTNKVIFWFAGNDYPETYLNNLVFRILADDNFGPGSPDGYVTLQTDSFVMGSPSTEPGSDWNERPQHNVNINRYIFMAESEVTQENWLSIMGNNPSANAGCDSCPVEQVSWNDAIDYCNALSINEGLDPAYIINGSEVIWSQFANGYFLPTEAIWEYACRASSTTAFANGEITELNCADPALDLIGWYCGNAEETTHQVATKAQNSWGIFDMHGNVSEWCWDYYEYGYYANSPEDNPTGPATGSLRVIRGGAFNETARVNRSATRNSALPETASATTGLRVCRWAEDGPAGTAYIQIDAEPNELNAPWTLTAPNAEEITGNGDDLITVSLMGEYTISWGDVEEWNTPSSESQVLIDGENITFTGEYNQGIDGMVNIPAGSFVMGSPDSEPGHGGYETEHTVTLTNSFYMSETEVTNQQYADLAQWAYDNGYCSSSSSSLTDNLDGSTQELLDLDDGHCEISFNGSTFTVDAGKENHPVKEVTWYGSVAYCDWLSLQEGLTRAYNHADWQCNSNAPYSANGYRLPTEAEWEYACRAGSTTAFANGQITDTFCNDPVLDAIGWYCGNAGGWTHPVAELIPNAWGLYDMHGNLYEWCNDWYGSYSGDITDPVGASSGSYRVLRGGSWSYDAQFCRSANRDYFNPYSGNYVFGFRFVRSVQ